MAHRAIFLDRDGTIIEDVGHLDSLDRVKLLPNAAEGIRALNEQGWLVVVVTNQSVIARGMLTEDGLACIHRYIDAELALRGARIDHWYYCPHHPEGTVAEYSRTCECRKPRPGMLLRAAKEHDIDLSRSWIIGDSTSDEEAGHRAGAKTLRLGIDVHDLLAASRVVGNRYAKVEGEVI